MARTRYTAEGIIGHLRKIEIETGKGLGIAEACQKLGITEVEYCWLWNEYGDRPGARYHNLSQEQSAEIRGTLFGLTLKPCPPPQTCGKDYDRATAALHTPHPLHQFYCVSCLHHLRIRPLRGSPCRSRFVPTVASPSIVQ